MKSSANRGTGSNRPPVRSASLNRNNNAAPGAVRTPSAPEMYGFTEEPYRDMSQQYQGATPVEEPFDYSMMGKPNNAAVVQKKKKSSGSSSRSSSSHQSSKKTSSKTKSKSAPAKSKPKKKKNPAQTKKVLAITVSLVAIAAVVLGALYAFGVFKPRIEVVMADGTVQKIKAEDAFAELTEGDRYYDGTLVNDMNIGGMTRGEARNAVSAALEAAPLNVNIDLQVEDTVYDLDLSSLTLSVNTDAILAEAYALDRPTDPEDLVRLTECYNAYQQLKNRPAMYKTAYTCSTDGLNELVHGVLDPLFVEQKDAVITGFDKDSNTFEVEPEVNGFSVDCDKAAEDVKALLDERIYEGLVEVDSTVSIPEITLQYINENFGKISSCSSTATNDSNRNTNLNQACLNIDGTVLNPGEEFSFNGVVGQRTEARGFASATVIAGGQTENGIGGGICQVSTMVYGAAVKANMEIVTRRAHAWPSSYCDPGLDATVDWGNIDLVFRNSSQYQVVIRAEFNSSTRTVSAAVYGHKLPDGQHIEFVSVVNSTTPHGATEYVANPNRTAGDRETLRNAHDGMNVTSYRVWYNAEGAEISREEVATTNYKMWVKKVEVGTLLPGGGHATLDTTTGEVITPTPAPTATPVPATPTPTTAPTEPDPTEPQQPEGGGDA